MIEVSECAVGLEGLGVPKLNVLLVMTPKLALSRSESSLERPVEGDLLGYGGPLQARACATRRRTQGPEAYSVGCIFGDRP